MLGTEIPVRHARELLAGVDSDAHASAEALCDRLRRLRQIAAAFAACARPEDLARAMPDALALVPAHVLRLVEFPPAGPAVTAAWPEAARAVPGAGASPASTSLEAGAPLWLESPEAIATRSSELAGTAALLGVHAWGAIPLCGGPIPAAVELGLSPAPRLDPTERAYLAVAACLAGGAILRARSGAAEADVTRLQESEARARRHAQELEAVIDLLPVGVLVISANGRIERMNPSARDLFGLGEPETWPYARDVLEQLAVEWPDGRPVELAETPFARARGGESVRDVLLTFRPPGDVRRWIAVNAVPLAREGRVERVVVTIGDVTRTREIELDRQELVRQLFHELAPPLKAIEERAEQIRDGEAEGASARAAEIVRAVRRMTSNLKEFESALRFDARSVAATNPELVDVKAFLLDLLERLAAEVDVARVILSVPPGLPRAHVDPDHLERILVDLVRGALAGAPGTDIGVFCAPVEGRLRVTVASSAQDIATEDLPRLFERFFRARGRPAGRLYLVRSLAEANRGRVHAASGPGRSLAIHVDLPLRAR